MRTEAFFQLRHTFSNLGWCYQGDPLDKARQGKEKPVWSSVGEYYEGKWIVCYIYLANEVMVKYQPLLMLSSAQLVSCIATHTLSHIHIPAMSAKWKERESANWAVAHSSTMVTRIASPVVAQC